MISPSMRGLGIPKGGLWLRLLSLLTLDGVMRCPAMLQLRCHVTPSVKTSSKLRALAMMSLRVSLKQRAALLLQKAPIVGALLPAAVRWGQR
jgi:hypothetical protein